MMQGGADLWEQAGKIPGGVIRDARERCRGRTGKDLRLSKATASAMKRKETWEKSLTELFRDFGQMTFLSRKIYIFNCCLRNDVGVHVGVYITGNQIYVGPGDPALFPQQLPALNLILLALYKNPLACKKMLGSSSGSVVSCRRKQPRSKWGWRQRTLHLSSIISVSQSVIQDTVYYSQ